MRMRTFPAALVIAHQPADFGARLRLASSAPDGGVAPPAARSPFGAPAANGGWVAQPPATPGPGTTPPSPSPPVPSPGPAQPPAPDVVPPEIQDPEPIESPVPVREPPSMPTPMARGGVCVAGATPAATTPGAARGPAVQIRRR